MPWAATSTQPTLTPRDLDEGEGRCSAVIPAQILQSLQGQRAVVTVLTLGNECGVQHAEGSVCPEPGAA